LRKAATIHGYSQIAYFLTAHSLLYFSTGCNHQAFSYPASRHSRKAAKTAAPPVDNSPQAS
jgi:hypothetical protein